MIQATYGAALAAAAAGRFQRSAVTSSSTACSSQRRDVTVVTGSQGYAGQPLHFRLWLFVKLCLKMTETVRSGLKKCQTFGRISCHQSK